MSIVRIRPKRAQHSPRVALVGGVLGALVLAACGGKADDGRDPVLGGGDPVTIAFAGDMAFEGSAGSNLAADPDSVFGPVSGILSEADLTVAHLETAVTKGGGAPINKQFTFSTGPAAFQAIKAAGIDVVSMANNHGMDYGETGFAESLEVREVDVPIVGMGANEDEAYAPFISEVRGQRVGVIGACPNEAQQSLTPQLVDAGADIVVGGHHHRVLSAGYSGAAFVGYGLGNFLFQANSEPGSRSGVLKVTATGRRIDDYEWLPARINEANQPIPAEGQEAQDLLADWNELRSCTGLTEAATVEPTPAG